MIFERVRRIRKNELYWNCGNPVVVLPEKLAKIFKEHAEFLYNDLNNNKQKVVLVVSSNLDYPEQKIRQAENRPPIWFSELYSISNTKKKRNSEKLSSGGSLRRRTLLVLSYIIENKDTAHIHMCRIRELIFDRLVNGYDYEGIFIPPDDLMKKVFGNDEDVLEF